jgi:hypothetical protein
MGSVLMNRFSLSCFFSAKGDTFPSVRRFENLEVLWTEIRRQGKGFDALRITVTEPNGQAVHEVVWIDEERDKLPYLAGSPIAVKEAIIVTLSPLIGQRKRFTVQEYHRLVELGFLNEDDHIERLFWSYGYKQT